MGKGICFIIRIIVSLNMITQNDELIPMPICGIEILDFLLALIYIVIPIAMLIIAMKSDMNVVLKSIIAIISITSCILATKELIDFLGAFESVHCKTSLFRHPLGVSRRTVYQSIRMFGINTFSLPATILTFLSIAFVIIRGYSKG